MKKFLSIFAISLLLISCSSVVVPNYVVDYSDHGKEERRLDEERIAAMKKARQQVKLQEDGSDSDSDQKYIKRYVPTAERDKCVRIVQISDFHSAMFGVDEDTLIQKVKDAAPDLIVFTGDIFDFDTKRERPVFNVRYLVEGIKDICPFYYVSGNHEYATYHEDEFAHVFTDNGGVVIIGKAEELKLPLGNIIVSGLPDPFIDLSLDEKSKKKDNKEKYRERINNLKVVVEKVKADAESHGDKILFTVLLAHRPEYIEDYRAAGCFDLVLSGHTHGGQWRFGNVIKGVYAPHQGFLPKYVGGLYEFFDDEIPSAMVISRGLSYQKPAVPRIGNNPELVVIDVVPHESRF